MTRRPQSLWSKNRRLHKPHFFFIALMLTACAMGSVPARAAVVDTFVENFDDRAEGTTIHGANSWTLTQGTASNAVTQSSVTLRGSGKALKLAGATTTPNVSRPASYGNLSPSWVEFTVQPGIGGESRSAPTTGIAAVTFDYRGKILATDGPAWQDTGKTFTGGKWYRVLFKLDFSTHTYDLYVSPAGINKIPFVPDAQNLSFVDSSINALNKLSFRGAYNTSGGDATYLDDIVVDFIDRLQIITALTPLAKDTVSAPLTVQLQNANSEPQTAWKDFTLELKSSSPGGQFSTDPIHWTPVEQLIIPEGGQAAVFYYKDSQVGQPTVTVSSYPDSGWTEALSQFQIVGESPNFDVVVTTPQIAGQAFTAKITAKENSGEIKTSFNGTVLIAAKYISPDSGALNISPEQVSGFKEGVAEARLVYPDGGTIEIKAEDAADKSKTGSSGPVVFMPAKFAVGVSTPQVVSKPFPLTVAALNALGSAMPNYEGPTGLKVMGVLPLDIQSGKLSLSTLGAASFRSGQASVDLNYNRWGVVHIEAYDMVFPAQSGKVENIEFRPAALSAAISSPPSGRNFFYTGEAFDVTLSALDINNGLIANYAGSFLINASPALGLPIQYAFRPEDHGQKIFTVASSSSGTYRVQAEESGTGLKIDSAVIEVKQATVQVISTSSPPGTKEVEIILVDETGRRITTESDLEFVIYLSEEIQDGSASLVGGKYRFRNGLAKVLVHNDKSEVVRLVPQTSLGLNVKEGTVTFGKITRSGIGTLLWREIKDAPVKKNRHVSE